MGTACPETSVSNYHSTLCTIPEGRRALIIHGGSLDHAYFAVTNRMIKYFLITGRLLR